MAAVDVAKLVEAFRAEPDVEDADAEELRARGLNPTKVLAEIKKWPTNPKLHDLDALGQGAQKLAKDIGIDVNEAIKALYEIIRSGVPAENSLEVVRKGAEAAKEIGTWVRESAPFIFIDNWPEGEPLGNADLDALRHIPAFTLNRLESYLARAAA